MQIYIIKIGPRMRAFFLKYIKPWSGLTLGIVCILVFAICRMFPSTTESIYGRILFPAVRFLLDFTFGLLAFPAIYLFLPILLFLLIYWFRVKGFKNKIRGLFNFTGYILMLFYLLWGFNYARPSIQTKHALHRLQISNDELSNFTLNCIDSLNFIRNSLTHHLNLKNLEQSEVKELQTVVHIEAMKNGFNVANNLRTREISPPGVLRKWGISGIYFPFTGEGLVEYHHNMYEKPFILAHEMSHGFGIADEGEANLLAYLACIASDNKLVKYSAHLAMWQYLHYEIRKRALFDSNFLQTKLSESVLNDLQIIREDQILYPEWFPNLSEHVNDAYLKTHGIEDGTEAYQSLPMLYLKYKKAAHF